MKKDQDRPEMPCEMTSHRTETSGTSAKSSAKMHKPVTAALVARRRR